MNTKISYCLIVATAIMLATVSAILCPLAVQAEGAVPKDSGQMGSRAPRRVMHRCSGPFIHPAPPGRAVDVDGERSKRRNDGGSSGDGIRS